MPQPFRIKTAAFPASDLLLESMSCTEGLSTLTEISASLLSPRSDLDADKILGQPVTFELELRDDGKRFLNGFVTRFSQTGASGRFHRYQAVVRPWLWFLTRTTDCRIFQNMKVPDIVKTVFDDHRIAVHDFKLFREYREWDYCVQYRESDFNFVSRLLEHEGIYYRFEHSDGKHQLLLLDSASVHDPQPDGAAELPFFVPGGQAPPDLDFVSRWAMSRSVQPGKFAITDYDFENPSSRLLTRGEQQRAHDLSDAEAFDYPGLFTKPPDGAQTLENRRDEVQSRFEVFNGSTNAQGLRVGFTFKLKRHPRADQNAEYLVTSTNLQANNGSSGAGQAGRSDGSGLQCEFSALPAAQQFRPKRSTRKPFVQGPQTAFVVGKQGDEIHTDKFGRVRVQFHWDRLGKKDEKSSCMVRVAQVWAGKNFGAIFIPRVGQEVIVDFLEGDPDQPIITGSVYNGETLPPFKLPDNATQSGFLSRSTKDGVVANANMIQFEDKKGAEALNLHAEKNMSTSVEADQSTSVGHDRSETIEHDDHYSVKHDRTARVGNNQNTEVVGTSDETVGKKLTQTYKNGQMVTVTHGYTQFITDYSNVHITGWRHEHVTGAASRNIVGASTNASGGDMKLRSGAQLLLHSDAAMKAKAASFLMVAAGDIGFRAATFTRVIGEGNDTILGKNSNGYIGHASDTKMGISETTFIGLKRDTSLALGMYFDGGLKLGICAGVALDIKASVGLSVTALGLEQKSLSLDQSGLKIITGGGGGGGGAAGAGSVAAGALEWAGVVAAAAGGAASVARGVADVSATSTQYGDEGASPTGSLAGGMLAGGAIGAGVGLGVGGPLGAVAGGLIGVGAGAIAGTVEASSQPRTPAIRHDPDFDGPAPAATPAPGTPAGPAGASSGGPAPGGSGAR